MQPRERQILIEAACSAWRPRTAGELPVHPAWYDLDEQGRQEAFETARMLRAMETLLDSEGMSTTVRAVLGRIREATRTEP